MYGRLRGLRSPSHPRVPGTLDAGATADGAPDAERKREEAEANEREEADHRAHSVLEDPRSAIQHTPGALDTSRAVHFRKHLPCSETKTDSDASRGSGLGVGHRIRRSVSSGRPKEPEPPRMRMSSSKMEGRAWWKPHGKPWSSTAHGPMPWKLGSVWGKIFDGTQERAGVRTLLREERAALLNNRSLQ